MAYMQSCWYIYYFILISQRTHLLTTPQRGMGSLCCAIELNMPFLSIGKLAITFYITYTHMQVSLTMVIIMIKTAANRSWASIG